MKISAVVGGFFSELSLPLKHLFVHSENENLKVKRARKHFIIRLTHFALAVAVVVSLFLSFPPCPENDYFKYNILTYLKFHSVSRDIYVTNYMHAYFIGSYRLREKKNNEPHRFQKNAITTDMWIKLNQLHNWNINMYWIFDDIQIIRRKR